MERSISSAMDDGSEHYVVACAPDATTVLLAAYNIVLTPEEAKRLRNKIDWHALPLVFCTPTFTPAQRVRN